MFAKYKHLALGSLIFAMLSSPSLFADSFTTTSPAGGVLPANISAVGGTVTDLIGLNGTRITAQIAASSEFVGYQNSVNAATGYLSFGRQVGVTQSIVDALGGGIALAAFRITLYDGDTQAGDFDYKQNFLYVGAAGTKVNGTRSTTSSGVNLGDFSAVTVEQTDGMGQKISNNAGPGFGDSVLDTGFFSSGDPGTLASLYTQLQLAASTNEALIFEIKDVSYMQGNTNQFYDFTQGLNA